MLGTARLVALLALAACNGGSFAQGERPSFQASSKGQGASFNLVVTETARFPSKSYLEVPGFHERSAPGARWLMCAYTALAKQRGFSHWLVVYPQEGSTRVVVGLTNSEFARAQAVLGSDYSNDRIVGERPMPVAKLAALCSW
jgi:hypothetical protein